MLNLYKFLIILLLPLFLFSQELQQSQIKLISKETLQKQETATKSEQVDNSEIKENSDDTLDLQNKLIEEVIDKINDESYLTTLPDKNFYDNEINFLFKTDQIV